MNPRFDPAGGVRRWRSLSTVAVTTPLVALLAGCETKEDKRYREQLATMHRLREQCEAQVPVGRGLESLNGMTDCWDRYPWPKPPKSALGQFGDFLREHPVITVVVGFVIFVWICTVIANADAKRKAQQAAIDAEQERVRAEAEAIESERLRQEEEARAAAEQQERAAAAEYERRFQEEIARVRRDEL
ncbi:hypothetical protein [Mycobacteroides abscessus]|uniref:hypothetical protein n=1 Tax=Mycobacteroides abscessus TaxID=36809 RepID=UPI0005E4D2BE|nr:hypothetical protein [Mycobacteroides abscessus]CPR73020.1 Uncharacterised protein [Mycobacteroides abscessus]CPU86022.1 Uncharacterised protein [Mycobacteroides abscessus]